MCIGFPSLLGAKILVHEEEEEMILFITQPKHQHHTCQLFPTMIIWLMHEPIIPILLRMEHTHTNFKQTIPWCLALSVTQNNNCKTQQGNFPLRHSCARGFMCQPPVGLTGREEGEQFPGATTRLLQLLQFPNTIPASHLPELLLCYSSGND